MLIIVLLLTLMLTLLGLYISRDIFAPYVAGPGVWLIALLIYYLLPNNFYPVTHDFPLALSLWLVGYFVLSVVCDKYVAPASPASVKRQPNKFVLRAYFIITITAIPVVCGKIIWQAFTTEPENIFRYMRILNTGIDEEIEMPDLGILIYFTSLAFVMLFFSYLYFKKKWLIGIVLFMNLLFATVTMSKTVFLSVMFSSLYICYYCKYIRIKHMFLGLIAFVALSFVVQNARAVGEDMETNNFLATYLSSSIVAFDYFAVPDSAVQFGEHTFRLLYAIGHSLGLCHEPTGVILEFVNIPNATNTYTNLYPFYEDFGLVGVFVFSMIYGAIYGALYKKARTGGKFELILYAILLTFVLMEFIGEFIFTNLSMFLQYLFFAVLPFLITDRQNEKFGIGS